jgi:sulfate permease, SulP family
VLAATSLGPVLDDLPEATLGALVFVAVIGLIKPSEIAFLARFDRAELGVAAITAGVGLTAGLLQAVAVGVVANLLLVLHELNHPDIDELRLTPTGDLATGGGEAVPGLLALRIGAPLYTANARQAQREVIALVDAADPQPQVVLLDAAAQGRLSVSVLSVMRELQGELAERGAALWFAGLPPRALAQARLAPGWAAGEAEGRLHRTVDEALTAFRHRTDESPPPAPSRSAGAGDGPS